jgi:hypothetical protein
MTYTDTFPLCEALDDFGWDDDADLRALVRTTPLLFGDDGLPAGYAGQPFGLEAAHLGGRA